MSSSVEVAGLAAKLDVDVRGNELGFAGAPPRLWANVSPKGMPPAN